jgi:hypothetical protein
VKYVIQNCKEHIGKTFVDLSYWSGIAQMRKNCGLQTKSGSRELCIPPANILCKFSYKIVLIYISYFLKFSSDMVIYFDMMLESRSGPLLDGASLSNVPLPRS